MLFSVSVINTIVPILKSNIHCTQVRLANARGGKRHYGIILDNLLASNSFEGKSIRDRPEYKKYSKYTKKISEYRKYLRKLHDLNIYIKRVKEGYKYNCLTKTSQIGLRFNESDLKLLLSLVRQKIDNSNMYSNLSWDRMDLAEARSQAVPGTTIQSNINYLMFKQFRNIYLKQLEYVHKMESTVKALKTALKGTTKTVEKRPRVLSFRAKVNKLYWDLKLGRK